jgi:hypothetical protein
MGRIMIGLAAFAVSACSQAATTLNSGNDAANVTAAAPANEVANASATAATPAQGRGVADPRAFVEGQYRAYQTNTDTPVEAPTYAYSDRLKALFEDYDAHQNPNEVGSIDFDWWINAQDWELHDVAVAEAESGPDAKTVTARFRNIDRREEVRFLFVRTGGRWYLDDAVQGSGHGGDGWTLSALLRERGQ